MKTKHYYILFFVVAVTLSTFTFTLLSTYAVPERSLIKTIIILGIALSLCFGAGIIYKRENTVIVLAICSITFLYFVNVIQHTSFNPTEWPEIARARAAEKEIMPTIENCSTSNILVSLLDGEKVLIWDIDNDGKVDQISIYDEFHFTEGKVLYYEKDFKDKPCGAIIYPDSMEMPGTIRIAASKLLKVGNSLNLQIELDKWQRKNKTTDQNEIKKVDPNDKQNDKIIIEEIYTRK